MTTPERREEECATAAAPSEEGNCGSKESEEGSTGVNGSGTTLDEGASSTPLIGEKEKSPPHSSEPPLLSGEEEEQPTQPPPASSDVEMEEAAAEPSSEEMDAADKSEPLIAVPSPVAEPELEANPPNEETQQVEEQEKETPREPLEDPIQQQEPLEDPIQQQEPLEDPIQQQEPLEDPIQQQEPLEDPIQQQEPLEDPIQQDKDQDEQEDKDQQPVEDKDQQPEEDKDQEHEKEVEQPQPEPEQEKEVEEVELQDEEAGAGVEEELQEVEALLQEQDEEVELREAEDAASQVEELHEEDEEMDDGNESSGIIKISAVASLSSSADNMLCPEDIAEATVALEETSKESSSVAGGGAGGGDVNGSSLSSSPRSNSGSNSSSNVTGPMKKIGLKLASFAGLGQNGIADTTPVSGHGKVSGCKQCSSDIDVDHDQLLIWETMQFCRESCLRSYQNDFNKCSSCKKTVTTTSVGKYCVRFGSDIKQFCSNVCLESYKKGLKVCCYCQKDISGGEGFLAPIGDKGQFKDFCLQTCLKRYEALHLGKVPDKEVVPCAVCSDMKPVELELLVKDSSSGGETGNKTKVVKLCSNPCFSAFKFANSLDTSKCDFCSMPYDIHASENVIYYGNSCKRFCTVSCQNVYVMKFRKIVPCQWCKVKKYNFDMVEKPNQKGTLLVYCSVNCLNLHGFARKGDNSAHPAWNGSRGGASSKGSMPVIQSVSSLAPAAPESPSMFPPPNEQPSAAAPPAAAADFTPPSSSTGGNNSNNNVKEVIKEYIVKCPEDTPVRNKATLTKPYMQTKGVTCRPNTCSKSTQTEASRPNSLLPVAVPFYMPVPMRMYAAPYPVPVPVPIPIPVPVFMPIKRNSLNGVLKAVEKLHSKLPSDPFEAELLAMAGAIADKASLLDSDSEDDILLGQEPKKENDSAKSGALSKSSDGGSAPDQVEDLEKEIIADKVVPKPLPLPTNVDPSGGNISSQHNNNSSTTVGRTRSGLKRRTSYDPDISPAAKDTAPPRPKPKAPRGRPPKSKQSRIDTSGANSNRSTPPTPTFTPTPPPKERPDSKHHLKFTYGVNAWKHWVIKKNEEFEKGQAEGKYLKSFETDLLKLRADELNYTLCMFVKEVKKPNGDSYAPDSVLYLTLGIQEYLFENGRIDNIFTDTYYEPFTSTLHEVVKDFKLPVNELGYFVTRIEEEHLWESKQLGCHTPQVLLNTLIYLNTKYFMLKTCDEHAKLSFTQIMKHWKKTMTPGKANQERTVLLRFHPQVTKGKAEDKKCYEQHENTENPARCPVKYYEQYIAKCPESAKSRNDVFYLQPERSCVADSPLWFSNEQLSTHQLDKMLQRLLMVREIQEHMLADSTS